MCDHLDISAVTFVGSSKVAEIVSTRCRSLNKRVLALGGAKNHLVALGDCDVVSLLRFNHSQTHKTAPTVYNAVA